jgi:hypothetical protein
LSNQKLHIVTLDVPFPADYGGAIDMYFRIKALHELGLELTLHVFEYGRGQQKELEKFGKVHYYKRSRSFFHLLSKRPFIVQSRLSYELLKELRKDSHPILFEGLHTSGFLEHVDIAQRLTMVRMHNIEHAYYNELAANARFFKRLFFKWEARKLKNYENILSKTKAILAIKASDQDYYRKYNTSTFLLLASVQIPIQTATKNLPYALFHGNLSVPENENAALWLIQTLNKVINSEFPLIIAGKNPGKRLQQDVNQLSVKLIPNPTENELNELIANAQLHVFYSSVPSGMKLKLLNVLGTYGHILCNNNMIGNSEIVDFCIIENDPELFAKRFSEIMNHPISLTDFEARQTFLNKAFNVTESCKLILTVLNDKQ